MLCSPNVLECTREMIVDEEKQFHLGSDHNVLLLNCFINSNDKLKQKSKCDDNLKHVIWGYKT